MFQNLIIADDFTGSNDTGMQLQRRGFSVNVFFKKPSVLPADMSVVLDTETRGLSADAAYEKVKQDTKEIDFSKFKYVIKKTDSLLRGNIPQEVKAIDEIYKSELVIFMPALPDLGRTTVNGVHCLNGIPITQTEMAQDPVKPVLEDHIQRLLQQAYDEKVYLITSAQIAAGDIDYSEGRLYAVDAKSNAEMQVVIKKALESGRKILFVGTAAMADNIFALEFPVKPAMGLVASVSEVTRKQVHQAEEAKIPIVNVKIPELMERKLELSDYVAQAVELLKKGRDVLVISSATYDRAELDRTVGVAAGIEMSREEASNWTQEVMGQIGSAVLDQVQVNGLFLAGGDTAMSFFKREEAEGSEIIGEVAAGIPLMKMTGGKHAGMKIVTKSGAFGNPDAIVYSLRKLKEA